MAMSIVDHDRDTAEPSYRERGLPLVAERHHDGGLRIFRPDGRNDLKRPNEQLTAEELEAVKELETAEELEAAGPRLRVVEGEPDLAPEDAEWSPFLAPGERRSEALGLPEWQGWPIPPRVALIGEAGAGKTTILGDVAAWYVSRGDRVLVVAAEAFDEWEDLRDLYPRNRQWFLYDWEVDAPRSPVSHRARKAPWDCIIVDPGIAALGLYDLEENDNGAIRRVMAAHIVPALAPGGHIWLAWHVGHQFKGRGRGQSDLTGWARLAMLYQREAEDETGYLKVTKANRQPRAYGPLAVSVDDAGRAIVEPAPYQPDAVNPGRARVRKGRRLEAVADYVRNNPGQTVVEVAEKVGVARPTLMGYLTSDLAAVIEMSGGGRGRGKAARLYPRVNVEK